MTLQAKPVMLMAGGTGGHVFPALAIAHHLREQGVSVRWLGTQRGLEARVVPQAGIPIDYVRISGLRGKGILRWLLAPLHLSLALLQSLYILWRCKPALVVGMGGFVTGPGGVAAWLLRIPLIIHEQNALPGLTNRILARLAGRVLQAFPDTFPASYHALSTGNPLRPALLNLPVREVSVHTPPRLLIVGGSLGARFLNETLPQAVQSLDFPLQIRHQTGAGRSAGVQAAYAGLTQCQAQAEDFIEDMAAAYAWADLVICRAGALTVSELAQAGLPAVLVPFPYAVDNHQTHNARFLVEAGAALLCQQAQLDAPRLADTLRALLTAPARLSAMSAAAKHCARPDALQLITDLCLQSCQNCRR